MTDGMPAKVVVKRAVGKVADALCAAPGRASVRVLNYHHITDGPVAGEWAQMTTPKQLFDTQMRTLKEAGYTTVYAEELPALLASAGGVPRKAVCVTFDDGYRDNLVNASSVLARYGMKATIFLTSDFVGRSGGPYHGYLGWDEIRRMRKDGIFSFGCHSRTHRNLARLPSGELDGEVRDAKRIIEDGLAGPVGTYAYPFGWQSSFDGRVIEAVKRAGFRAAFTGIYGANASGADLFRLRRIRVSWLEEPDEFAKILRGSYDWYSMYQGIVSLWHKA